MPEEPAVRIWVVDDEEAIRCSLVEFLDDAGYEARAIASAESALEMLSREQPDVVIVDLRLPGMSGDRFIVNAHQKAPNIRFLIYTGSVAFRVPDELRAIGVESHHVYLKPLADLKVIAEAIETLCK